MNLTGGNTLPNIGKRINWQLVMLAGGLAVAVGAAAGLGAFERTAAPPTPAQPAASVLRPVAGNPNAAMPRPVMYVVESSEQEALFTAAIDADRLVAVMEGQEVPFQLFLVVSTPEDELALNQTLMEQLELSVPAFNLVDLRVSSRASAAPPDAVESAQPLPVVYIVASQEHGLRLTDGFEADLLAVQGFDVPVRPASFLVVSTPEEEQALNETMMEQQLLTEPTLDIVDMRR